MCSGRGDVVIAKDVSGPIHPQKHKVSGVFHRASDTYDAVGVDFFEPLAAALVARADLRPGESVLDLGTGRGAALFAAARIVGPEGEVVGIDLAEGMVERTSADIHLHGLSGHVHVRHGDADHPPARDGGWDTVVASFVLFFLPDPAEAAERIRSVLRPSGRFVMSSFDTPDQRWKIVEEAVRPFWVDEIEPAHPATRPWFATVDSVTELMAGAGFVDIDTVVIDHDNIYSDVDHWLAWTWSAGARAIWERVREGELSEALAAAREAVSSLAEPDGTLVESFRVRLSRAVKP
ncbi:unannotated protein [freshwater metagenome]|uniref:Unannotated protein n=1 Tax=freshwater metagenome TaxID=449393 RepID=A0A6J7R9Y1_9ZZZZ